MYGNEQLDHQTEVLTIYAFSHVESWLEYFAKSNSIPFEEFAQRVATILYTQAGGEVSRLDDNVPSLRRESTEGNQTTREVEMDERPHSEARGTKAVKQDRRGKYTLKKIPCKVCGEKVINRSMGAHVKYAHGSIVGSATKPKRKLSPAVLKSLRKTAAHTRQVLADRRKNGNGVHEKPVHELTVPAAVTDAMSAYQEAVATEDKSIVNV